MGHQILEVFKSKIKWKHNLKIKNIIYPVILLGILQIFLQKFLMLMLFFRAFGKLFTASNKISQNSFISSVV